MAKKKSKRDRSAPQESGASMADLPVAIFLEIMLKLSTWSIVMSKSVCKTWRDLISNPRFAKLHLAQAEPCSLLRYYHHSRISRALYLLEPEAGDDFGVRHRWCEFSDAKGEDNRCHHIEKVKSVLKLPLRNAHTLLSCIDGGSDLVFCAKGSKMQAFVEVNSKIAHHTFSHISSCNGLICLSDSHLKCLAVCNPITGEFISLPKPPELRYTWSLLSFGFSPKSGQYKVLRITEKVDEPIAIHTLGTSKWRVVSVVSLKWKLNYLGSPIYFNGAIHWFCSDDGQNHSGCMTCFDLEEERFRSSIPLPLCLTELLGNVGMSVLGSQLCVYEKVNDNMKIWAMYEYGVAESWTKLVSVEISSVPLCKPLSRSNDDAFLMFNKFNSTLIYCDKSGELRFKHVKSRNALQSLEAFVHILSFVSLKDMVDTTAIEVHNVYSRLSSWKRLIL